MTARYLPGTLETDQKKVNQCIQNLGNDVDTNTTNIATINSNYVGPLNGKTGAFSLKVVKQIFTASGTYAPTAGMIYCIIECVGPGGGGGAAVGAASSIRVGAGGSAGGYSRLIASAATIGASQTVTVGTHGSGGAAGTNNGTNGSGATSVGSLCIANAGNGGKYSDGTQIPNAPAVAASGTGDLAVAGNASGAGVFTPSTNFLWGGQGAAGPFGGGPLMATLAAATANTGPAGNGYGSGGSGGMAYNVVANAAGGNGVDGVVFITEYVLA